MTRFGSPIICDNFSLNILPEGELLTKFAKLFRKTYYNSDDENIKSNYSIIMPDYENDFEEIEFKNTIKLGIHSGIIELKERKDIWKIFETFHGEKCPSGLIVRIDEQPWSHITITELNSPENKYFEIFRAILDLEFSNVFSKFELENNLEDDLNKFSEIKQIDTLLDVLNKNNFKNVLNGLNPHKNRI